MMEAGVGFEVGPPPHAFLMLQVYYPLYTPREPCNVEEETKTIFTRIAEER